MTDKFRFRNRDEVRDAVDNMGLEYLITGYCRCDAMPDDELKAAFDKVEMAIDRFKELIEEKEGLDETR